MGCEGQQWTLCHHAQKMGYSVGTTQYLNDKPKCDGIATKENKQDSFVPTGQKVAILYHLQYFLHKRVQHCTL